MQSDKESSNSYEDSTLFNDSTSGDSTLMLKDLLSDLGLPENSADPFVASADYLLGYEDGKNDVFVSIWPVCYGISCVTAVIPYFLTYKPSKSKIANKSSDYIMGYTKSFNENSKKLTLQFPFCLRYSF